ncbi:hypothetical protein INT47_000961 [Mucor saturninus]|uniref:Uncharacterized protein n=1 Tax=Mucor saturninus TaxID=64648 RepID=A0A8H7RPP0_9FUNG|nr:hypothetical protein INT47_000961 [Mucor saturninus]
MIAHVYIGPLILWSILSTGIVYGITKSALYRSPIVYAALLPAVFGLLTTIMNTVVYSAHSLYTFVEKQVAVNIFKCLYASLAALPGLIAYQRISRQKEKTSGRWAVYLGFIYVFIVTVAGIVFACINNYDVPKSDSLRQFITRGNYGVIGVFALLLKIYGKRLPEKAKITLLMYTLFYMISEIFYSVAYDAHYFMFDPISVALVQCPMFACVVVSVLYGHIWSMDKPLDDEKDESESELEFEDEDDDNENDNIEASDVTDNFLQV